jgi:proliferating cell nuclear antigen
MFVAKLNEVQVLKKIVEAIKDIVNVVNIDAGPGGLSFQAMDLSHVALVSLLLRSDGFQSYRADKNFPLGVKLANLHKILKCADNSDIVAMECEDEPQQLHFKFESQRQDKVSKFSLNLMMQEDEQLQIPQTVYASRVTMPSTEFARIVRELSQLSESVKIATTKKSISFSVSGDVVSGEMELRENNSEKQGEAIRINVEESVSNAFSLTFLNSFTKASSLSDCVHLYMSENTPLVVEYQIGDFGSLKYYLAPKLSEE